MLDLRILRARNLLLIVVFVYAVMTIVFCIAEINGVAARTSNMRSVISLAADMSVSQALASDEFFNDTGAGATTGNPLYSVKGVTSIRTADSPNATKYLEENIFKLVYGINTGAATADQLDEAKEDLYTRMFGLGSGSVVQNEAWMKMAIEIKSSMPSLSQYGGTGNLPNIARLGLLEGSSFAGAGSGGCKWLQGGALTALHTATKDAVVGGLGHSIKNMTLKQFDESHHADTCLMTNTSYYSHYNETSDWLHLFNIAKTYTDSNRTDHTYYLAPTNVGITYLDPYILETAFVSNMDLLMRGELVAEGGTLSSGLGIVSNGMSGKAQITDSADVHEQFIINNGKFSFVKGKLLPTGDSIIGGWSGGETKDHNRVLPTIDYFCLDITRGVTEPDVRTLVFLAVGLEAKYYYDGSSATYKDWLISLGIDPDKPYNVMIARVTFYADAFTSYNTTIARDLYSMFVRQNNSANTAFFKYGATSDGNIDNDLFQMRDIAAPNNPASTADRLGSTVEGHAGHISDVTDLPYYMYTTYYAVMP